MKKKKITSTLRNRLSELEERAAQKGIVIHYDLLEAAGLKLKGGICMCPLVMNNFVELTPSLCVCSTQLMEKLLTNVTKKSVKVDLVKSIALGDEECAWKAKI